MMSFISSHKRTLSALLFAFLFSTTVALATPPGTPYTANETLDPNCGPSDTNCFVDDSLLTGTAGGQTVVGGTQAGDNLILTSTSNTTKGKILFGDSAYDEVNDRLGIGTVNPQTELHIANGELRVTGASGKIRWHADDNGAIKVKTAGDTLEGLFNLQHDGDFGYIFHLMTGPNATANIATIGIGVDNGGRGILISNKKTGKGLQIDNHSTITSSTSYGLLVYNESVLSPGAYFTQGIAGAAPAAEFYASVAIPGQKLVRFGNLLGQIGYIDASTGLLYWEKTARFDDNSGVGGGVDSTSHFTVGGNISETAFQFGILAKPTFSNAATSRGTAISAQIFTQASVYTMNEARTIDIYNPSKGLGSTINNAYGLYIQNITAGSNNNYSIYSAGGQSYFAGLVGIGQITPSYLLHVGSSSVTTGTTVARFQNAGGTCDVVPSTAGGITCTSDETLKKNITTLSGQSWSLREGLTTQDNTILDSVLMITPVMYNMKAESDSANKHAGFIAQELEQLFPDLVRTDAEGYKSVNYAGMMPYTVAAIQELDIKVAALPQYEDTALTERLAEFFRGVAERGEGLFTRVKTKELCVDDVCVTRDQFMQMLQNSGTQPYFGGSGSITPDPVVETGNEEQPVVGSSEPVVTPPADEPEVEEQAPSPEPDASVGASSETLPSE